MNVIKSSQNSNKTYHWTPEDEMMFKNHKFLERPDLPPRILLDLHGGQCNLKCPKCYVHGQGDIETIKKLRGTMSLEQVKSVLDEVNSNKPLIHPNLWTEPLLAKNFTQHIRQIKEAGMPVSLNTNGLLLDDDMAQFFVDVKLDSMFISIDALTPEVLALTRGITKLNRIEDAVFRMLKVRELNKADLPRIGVSFTTEEANAHQRDEFVKKWIKYVDVVRVGELYGKYGKTSTDLTSKPRIPCGSLYETLAIHHNGKASICCLDGYQNTDLGNVFSSGVYNVWNGTDFQRVRYLHETAQFEKVPFCKDCDVWANYIYTEEMIEEEGLIIRKSPLMTYYNRIDRLKNYRGGRGF